MAKCPRNAFPRRSTVTRFSRDAFPGALPWQDFAAMRSRAAIRGNFLTPCIPKGASDGKNRPFLARFARHASEMSWLWQDMRAMYPKSPANAVRGYTARRSCQEGAPFAARAPRIMRGARILPSAAKQRERSQPRRRPYGRRNGARAASCRAG